LKVIAKRHRRRPGRSPGGDVAELRDVVRKLGGFAMGLAKRVSKKRQSELWALHHHEKHGGTGNDQHTEWGRKVWDRLEKLETRLSELTAELVAIADTRATKEQVEHQVNGLSERLKTFNDHVKAIAASRPVKRELLLLRRVLSNRRSTLWKTTCGGYGTSRRDSTRCSWSSTKPKLASAPSGKR